MSKGTLTILIDEKTGKMDVDIELPNDECVPFDLAMDSVLELLGVESGPKTFREPRPGQTEGHPAKKREGTGNGE